MGVNPADDRTFNRYSYAANNPYKLVDPGGEIFFLAVAVPFLKGAAVIVAKEAAMVGFDYVTGGAASTIIDVLSARRAAAGLTEFTLKKTSQAVREAIPEMAADVPNKGLKDGDALSTDNALDAAQERLGSGYTEIDRGVFKSADGKRMVRMTDSDLSKVNNHAGSPHMNFESGKTVVKPNGKERFVSNENKHIYLPEEN
jgi:hypothetical protein